MVTSSVLDVVFLYVFVLSLFVLLPPQERPPQKDKVQPHLLQLAITDMMTQVEELGQVNRTQDT